MDYSKKLYTLFQIQKAIRLFLESRGYIEVSAPSLVPNPGMEPHIHPFQVAHTHNKELSKYFLPTSPEFWMKHLLSEGFEKIFNMGFCFRDEPESETHRPQFIMLEWYQAKATYEVIMEEVFELVCHCSKFLDSDTKFDFLKLSIRDAFIKWTSIDIFQYSDTQSFASQIKSTFPEMISMLDDSMDWDDLFHLLFLNKIEPKLKELPFCLLYEYPASQAALSEISPENKDVCKRFEIYINGIEIANCFQELTDLSQQKKRMQQDQIKKKDLYHYSFEEPDVLYKALEKGLPPCSGIALGVERLAMALTNCDDLFIHSRN